MAIGAHPYCNVPACSGKIKFPNNIIVTVTDANTPNDDSILGIYLDFKDR